MRVGRQRAHKNPGPGWSGAPRQCPSAGILETVRGRHDEERPGGGDADDAHAVDFALFGQIAFPGGKLDPTDASPLAAALREAEEEVGLDRRFVHPIGYLDVYMTTLGFRIVPTLARVDPDSKLTLSPAEVHDAFEVPLRFLMQPDNYQRRRREWRGMMRTTYAIPFGDRDIWGVTAGILRNLYERLYA